MHGKKTGRQTEKRVKVMEIEKRKKEWVGGKYPPKCDYCDESLKYRAPVPISANFDM